MIAVVQRVKNASVTIESKLYSEISQGFLVLLGVMRGDTKADADKLAAKIANLRIFEDDNEKMNLSCLDINGQILVVSQFTLGADCTHGRRPNFLNAAPPDEANPLYEYFSNQLSVNGISDVKTGVFGADMAVNLLNDGPVTIILDSKELK